MGTKKRWNEVQILKVKFDSQMPNSVHHVETNDRSSESAMFVTANERECV